MTSSRSRRGRLLLPFITIASLLSAWLVITPALALDSSQFASPAFQRTWERTDKPVEDNTVQRSWVWGSLVDEGSMEPYAESPDGMRQVQYFDKARMEITHPEAVDDGLWYVTTGLLVRELMTGDVQVGDATFEHQAPADIPAAGDPDDPDSPTYADLGTITGEPAAADGATLTLMLHPGGEIMDDPTLASQGVTAAYRVTVPGIDHQIASVFWDYMNSSGTVWEDGANVDEPLFQNPFYATGFPVTEAYWTNVKVGGVEHLVLLQCFERRCLTYTPENDPEWRVEMGNVGLHYWNWRHVAPATPTLFIARLAVYNEVPAVEGASGGLASFAVSDDHQSIRYHLEVENIVEATMAHIHIGAAGVNGGIVVWLFDGMDSPFTGSGTLADGTITADMLPEGVTIDDLAQMAATGDYYVNVHTTAHPGGEIRGQMEVADDLAFEADLDSGQEVADPPVESDASGQAALYYDADTETVDYTVRVADIDNTTASHIHLAPAGQNGPVVVPFMTPTVDTPSTGSFTAENMTASLAGQSIEQLVYALLTGGAYVNVHSSDYPPGEIRGQVYLLSPHIHPILFDTDMFGSEENPPNDIPGSGTAAFSWRSDTQFDYTVVVADLEHVTASHIHLGAAGENGPIVVPLYAGDAPTEGEVNGILASGSFGPSDFIGPLAGQPAARLAYEMVAGNTYTNVHSAEYPKGAIRGQIDREQGLDGLFFADLQGSNVVPPFDTSATGVGIFRYYHDPETGAAEVDWFLVVGGIEDLIASHVHQGTSDINGPVVVNLVIPPQGEPLDAEGLIGIGTVTDEDLLGPLEGFTVQSLVNDMIAGNSYVAVHSVTIPSGEIRGTIVPFWLP